MPGAAGPRKVFVVAGETSGDVLGAKLMHAMRVAEPDIEFAGVGGVEMEREGLESLFPMADIAVMGFLPVLRRLRNLLRRIRQTADACIVVNPDVLVIIDSPDFTHRVARRVRQIAPKIAIVNYVSPTVWAWREGRARRMRAYIDHVLAVLPFEPAAHERLGGPACTYVGHPLVTRYGELRPREDDAALRKDARRVLVLPGSRGSEVARLMPVFGDAVARLAAAVPEATFHLPVVPHVANQVKAALTRWPVKPELVEGEAAKFAAFRTARAALAASGTVTLELGLSQVPMVAAYRVSKIEEKIIAALVKVNTPVLPSLILGREVSPIFLQEAASGQALAKAMLPLVNGGAARDAQLAAFEELDRAMAVPGNSPSDAAAAIALRYAHGGRTG